MAPNLEERLAFSPVELEQLVPFTRETWQRWAREGQVRAHTIGRRVVIPREEIVCILQGEVRDEQPA